MVKIEVDSFSNTPNAAVIRLPGRRFPGIVIQGDSLKILHECVEEVARQTQELQIPALRDAADELRATINGYLQEYERAMREHNEPLPYSE